MAYALLMSARDYEVYKEIASLDGSILGAGIIEDMDVVAMYAKPKVPLLNGEIQTGEGQTRKKTGSSLSRC